MGGCVLNRTEENSASENSADVCRVGWPCFIGALILLAVSIFLRRKFIPFFLTAGTIDYSASVLFQGYADEWAVFLVNLKKSLASIVPGYFISAVLLALSAALFYKSLASCPRVEKAGEFFRAHQKSIVTAFSLLFLIMMLAAFSNLLGGMPVSTDEHSYFFQSCILKEGKLFAEPPATEIRDFFPVKHVVMTADKWYSKYTIGFPLLLALGTALGMPWLVNILLSIGTAFFIVKITEKLFDVRAAWFSGAAVLISPFFFFNGAAAFQPHMALGFSMAGSLWFFLQSLEKKGFLFPFLTGAFISFGALVRPVDGAVFGPVLAVWALYHLYRSTEKKALLLKYFVMLLAGFAGLFVILAVNKAQTGEYLKFAFHQYQAVEKWGFQGTGHTIIRGLWNTVFGLFRLMAWSGVFFLTASLFSLFGKNRKKSLFLWGIFAFNLFYFFGWHAVGSFEYGPRYYFLGFLFLIPAAAEGAGVVIDMLGKRGWNRGVLTGAIVTMVMLYTLIGVYEPFIGVMKEGVNNIPTVTFLKTLKSIRQREGRDVMVFIASAETDEYLLVNRNRYPLKDNPVLCMLMLEPEKCDEAVNGYFGSRKALTAFWNNREGRYVFSPRVPFEKAPEALKSDYYMYAGLARWFGLGDYVKAPENFEKAIEINPSNRGALFNAGRLFEFMRKYDKAEKYWLMLHEKAPGLHFVHYKLGVIKENQNKLPEALELYRKYIELEPNTPFAEKARQRIQALEKKS